MDRQQTVEQMKQKLDKWNSDITALEDKAHDIAGHKKTDFDATVAELKAKSARAQKELAQLRAASDEAFADMSRGVHDAWERVAAAFSDAKQRFN